MDAGFLDGLGLTGGEARTYIALLELGETTAGPLVTRTKMQKTTVYLCLDKLMDKGLVSRIIQNNRRRFKPLPPDRIIEYLDRKEKEIENQKTRIRELMPKIVAMGSGEQTEASFFSGWNGMKSAFDDILRTMKKGDEYCVFGVSVTPDTAERMRRFLARFHQERDELGIKVKIIVNEELKDTIGADRKEGKHSDVRFVGKEFSTPAVINVYGDRTLIAVWGDAPAAVLIKNRDTAESFRNYFKLIWGLAKE
ncbi:MAG: TrmB family transcriptional regulator [Candidatus Bilamarchaeaceae archaeon]